LGGGRPAQAAGPTWVFIHQPSVPILGMPAQAGYGDKWLS
jgi:hypothetical protein